MGRHSPEDLNGANGNVVKRWATMRDLGSWRRPMTVTPQFDGRSAPFSWINVRNGLRETPVVPCEVLNIILSFAARIVRTHERSR